MIVDTSAIVAILTDEPEALDFLSLIEKNRCLLSAGNHLECILVLDRKLAGKGLKALDDFLARHNITIAPVTEKTISHARQAHVKYGKGNHKAGLNFGDCFAYGLSKEMSQPLLFKGDDFAQTDVECAVKAAA